MKIRSGYVSNSSSSSFILAFRNVPENPEELKQLLFAEEDWLTFYEYSLTTKSASKIIFETLGDPVKEEDISRELQLGEPSSDKYPIPPRYCSGLKENDPQTYEEYLKERELYLKNIADDFLKRTKYHTYYIVEYCDNFGSYFVTLEHADTFKRIPHLRVNKH